MLKLVGAVLIIFASAGLGYLKRLENLCYMRKILEEFLQVIFMPERRDTVRKQLAFGCASRYGMSMSGKVRGVFSKGWLHA